MDGHKMVSGLSRGCPLWVILWVLLNGWEKGPWRNRPDEKGRVGAGLFRRGCRPFSLSIWSLKPAEEASLNSWKLCPVATSLTQWNGTVYIWIGKYLIEYSLYSVTCGTDRSILQERELVYSRVVRTTEQLKGVHFNCVLICDDPALLISTIYYGQSVMDQVLFAVLLATRCFRQPSPCW